MSSLSLWAAAVCVAAAGVVMAQEAGKMPMSAAAEHAAAKRWLAKKVLRRRLVADMESLKPWKISTWAQGKGEIALTDERFRDGKHSLRFRSRTTGAKPSRGGGVFGSTAAVRTFAQEDWRAYNRLSFWVWPNLPGHHAASLMVRLGNRGKAIGRNTHHVLLDNGRWNRVVWEVPDVARDAVTEVAFTYVMNGSERGAAAVATFDIDRLEIQRVEADPYEGWAVWPERIAFSHSGYPADGRKVAIASGMSAEQFAVIDCKTKRAVLTRAVETAGGPVGRFQVMDFTDLRTPGEYVLCAGSVETQPFRIGDDVWRRTVRKAINFFYVERCGCAVPGVHGVCHKDWFGEHEGRRIVINGGWHDAGDLSQGLVNTSEAACAMFALAGRLGALGRTPALRKRLIEEAKWGLAWVMKTSFHDGHRIQWATHRFWTNNTVGDVDDVVAEARYQAAGSFYAAACEAIGCRALAEAEPALAKKALAMAREDWRFGADALAKRRPDDVPVEQASVAALASLELYRATGRREYVDKARALARGIVRSQQREVPAGMKRPLTGFFYCTPRRRRVLTYQHRGHEQAPIVALAGLCEAMPDDPAWIDWYAAVVLHSRYYQQAMSAFTRPYRMLCNSVRHVDEAKRWPKNVRDDVAEQIAAGFDLGGGYRLRVYPVQPRATFRGNYGCMLSQAKAVAAAAHLRRDLSLADLAREQLYWVVGRNPFCQSTMYGEGYDFAPQYTARSGDIVGSLPVGMKSLGNRDRPYWPFTNVWNYKEVWAHPVSRWLWLMCDVGGPAAVGGRAGDGARSVMFRERRSGAVLTVKADAKGAFRSRLPAGAYDVQAGEMRATLVALPMREYELDLRPGGVLNLALAHRTHAEGRVTLSLTVECSGRHEFVLRAHNLTTDAAAQTANLGEGGKRTLTWQCKTTAAKAPWVAVIVPDGDVSRRVEATDLPAP